MRLPDIELDDRRFEELVMEARLRIAQACPEWNTHNVSDPGMALIEVFAWMTDQLLYRVDRIPDKLHVRLLDYLGIQLAPPVAATTDLRFMLAAPPADPVHIPESTEVATLTPARGTGGARIVLAQVSDGFTIPAAHMVAFVIAREGELRAVDVDDGRARPRGDDRLVFGEPPLSGNAIYLGFDQPLARLLVRLSADCAPARRIGGDRGEAPLRWQVSTADGSWSSAEVLEDTTGGLEHEYGTILLKLPDDVGAAAIGARRAHFDRCDIVERRAHQPVYDYAPEIEGSPLSRSARACPPPTPPPTRARPSARARARPARFQLLHTPVLHPVPGETLQVRDPLTGRWEDWELRGSFAESGAYDRHYVLDLAAGIVEFGPADREALGYWRRCGGPSRGARP